MTKLSKEQQLQLWFEQHHDYNKGINELLIEAIQYGADRELEACCEWLKLHDWVENDLKDELRAARRPKPPSLREQALKELAWVSKHLDMPLHNRCNAIHIIHQALKKLDD